MDLQVIGTQVWQQQWQYSLIFSYCSFDDDDDDDDDDEDGDDDDDEDDDDDDDDDDI